MTPKHRLPLETWGRHWLDRTDAWAAQSRWRSAALELIWFGLKQAWACLFGGALLAMLVLTHLLWPDPAPVARYDALVVGAVLIQVSMLVFRLESWAEARVILLFHIAGTVMELFKTYHGSWIYPEESVLRIGAVPLFSGFMYAAVGSYIARVQRIFHIRVTGYPPLWTTWLLAGAIYVNFFSHHWLPDVRLGLFVATGLLFWRTRFWFTADRQRRSMPQLAGFAMVAVSIWVAENLATFARAWVYPAQADGWSPVSLQKLGAWFLLMIISVVLVRLVHRPEEEALHCQPTSTLAVSGRLGRLVMWMIPVMALGGGSRRVRTAQNHNSSVRNGTAHT
jgi:Uncharacterized integral membrane protein